MIQLVMTLGLAAQLASTSVQSQQPKSELTFDRKPNISFYHEYPVLNGISLSKRGYYALIGARTEGKGSEVFFTIGSRRQVLSNVSDYHVWKTRLSTDAAFGLTQSLGMVRYWQFNPKQKLIKTFKTQEFTGGFCVSPDFKVLAITSQKKDAVEVWNLPKLTRLATLKSSNDDDSMCFSSSGKRLAMRAYHGKNAIDIWDWSKRKPRVKSIPTKQKATFCPVKGTESVLCAEPAEMPNITRFYLLDLQSQKVKKLGGLPVLSARILYAEKGKAVILGYTDGGIKMRLGVIIIKDKVSPEVEWIATSSNEILDAAVDPTGTYIGFIDPAGRLAFVNLKVIDGNPPAPHKVVND